MEYVRFGLLCSFSSNQLTPGVILVYRINTRTISIIVLGCIFNLPFLPAQEAYVFYTITTTALLVCCPPLGQLQRADANGRAICPVCADGPLIASVFFRRFARSPNALTQ